MDNIILFPLMFACFVIVVLIARSVMICKASHVNLDDAETFDDWYYDECWIAASELVGPNSPEYDQVFIEMHEDPVRKAKARKFYDGMR